MDFEPIGPDNFSELTSRIGCLERVSSPCETRSHASGGLMSAPALRTRDLVLAHGDHVAIGDATMDLPAGAVIAVIGPNGSGKSSLLDAVSGLLAPAAGVLEVFGAPPGRAEVAYVLQRTDVPPHLPLTVREVVTMGRYRSTGLVGRLGRSGREAVDAALDWVERHAVWSRRGKGGVRQLRTEGLIAAAFKHRTSRNGDPHLHTHVLVPNMVLGEDGKWATPDARWFYLSAKTAGYLYEAQLRHSLTAALGVEWGAVENGIADIEHIPDSVLKAFSTRRAEIEKQMEARGQHSAKAAMIAALDTRKTKRADPGAVELRTRWAEQVRQMGYDPSRLREAIGRTAVSPISDADQAAIEERLLGAEGLTSHDSTFDRHDILQAWCDALPAGAPIERIEELTETLIAHPETAVLGDTGHGDVIRDAGGRIISAADLEKESVAQVSGEGDAFSGKAGKKNFISIGVGDSGLGTAVAYAQVNDNPLGFVAQRTSGFAGLTRPSAGLYCLAPTASVADVAFDGAQPTRPTVASVEYGNTGTQTDTLIVEPRGGTFTCPGGTFEVRTYRNGALASDVAFTLIVP